MTVYHGTQVHNIEVLTPIATRGNAISKPVICFTPNPSIALFYIWNRSYKWVAFREDENGKVIFTEQYENMFFDFYNRVSGSIYECNGDSPSITATHMPGVYVSEVPVRIEKETIIPNAYEEILKQETLGNIAIRRDHQLSLEEKAKISHTTIRAIHMQKLLFPPSHASMAEQTDFVKSHFPNEWEIASKMTQKEIDEMIAAWRASVNQKS